MILGISLIGLLALAGPAQGDPPRIVAHVGDRAVTVGHVERYIALRDGGFRTDPRDWLAQIEEREVQAGAHSVLASLISHLGGAKRDESFSPQRRVVQPGVAFRFEPKESSVVVSCGNRSHAVDGFPSPESAELAVRAVQRALSGETLAPTAFGDVDALKRLAFATMWTTGTLPDEIARLRVTTWLDTFELDGPFLRVAPATDEWPSEPPWSVPEQTPLALTPPARPHPHFDAMRDELLWILAARAVLDAAGGSPALDEVWREFAEDPAAYAIRDGQIRAPPGGRQMSDYVARVVLALHLGYRRTGAGASDPPPVRDASAATRWHVDLAALVLPPMEDGGSSKGDLHAALERVHADIGARGQRTAFDSLNRNAAMLFDASADEVFGFSPPAWLTSQQILRHAALDRSPWPEVLGANGWIGRPANWFSLAMARPGDLLAFENGMGATLVFVLERSDPPARGPPADVTPRRRALPSDALPLVSFCDRIDAWMAEHVRLVDSAGK